MDDGHYILPNEFAILVAFMLSPALLVASAGQFWFLRRCGSSLSRTWLSILVMAVASTVVTIVLWVLAAGSLPRVLALQEFFVGPMWVPILPLAFIVSAVLASAVSFWVRRRAQAQPGAPADPLAFASLRQAVG